MSMHIKHTIYLHTIYTTKYTINTHKIYSSSVATAQSRTARDPSTTTTIHGCLAGNTDAYFDQRQLSSIFVDALTGTDDSPRRYLDDSNSD